jgi:hypothetical protein
VKKTISGTGGNPYDDKTFASSTKGSKANGKIYAALQQEQQNADRSLCKYWQVLQNLGKKYTLHFI